MADPDYEATRGQRALQASKLLRCLALERGMTLLDVGAGSGILVEEAGRSGLLAEGVEPSQWLAEQAISRGLTVHQGTLSQLRLTRSYDIVTLIDVIEHVSDPVALLRAATERLAPGGSVVVITPNIRSLAARALGTRWWHFRVAHVGYFTVQTLDLACQQAGLERRRLFRPNWYFSVEYLWSRLAYYVPALSRIVLPARIGTRTIAFNLLDSIAGVYRKKAP
jgi:cyclopropane fatty-acyl-phospholipid synthase-like methyltransferase